MGEWQPAATGEEALEEVSLDDLEEEDELGEHIFEDVFPATALVLVTAFLVVVFKLGFFL